MEIDIATREDLRQFKREMLDEFKQTIGYLKLVDGTLKKILGNMRERETLKSRFRQVLDYYITQREALGWPVSAAKKEELAKHARQSLDNL